MPFLWLWKKYKGAKQTPRHRVVAAFVCKGGLLYRNPPLSGILVTQPDEDTKGGDDTGGSRDLQTVETTVEQVNIEEEEG